MATSPQGRKIRRDLQKELEEEGRRTGQKLEFSAAEMATIDMICADFDRICELQQAYDAARDAEEAKLQVKLSTEIRLLEQSAARLLKTVKTEVTAAPSATSRRASAAAHARWDRERRNA